MHDGWEETTESRHRKKDTNMHTYIEKDRDRQRNNRITRELHELRCQKSGYHACSEQKPTVKHN